MRMYGATHTGLVRPTNQDNFHIDEAACWAVVADGMGGHKGGEIASKIAVEKIKTSMAEGKALKDVLVDANTATYKYAVENPEVSGMGTTVVLCKLSGDNVNIAHVGDSRAYLYKNGELLQITKDHSIVQQLIDCGTITEEQAKYHPQKNLITRAVGTERVVVPDYTSIELSGKNSILICSDGLSSYVEEKDVLNVLDTTHGDEAVSKLIDLANDNGGKDNVTVVLIEA